MSLAAAFFAAVAVGAAIAAMTLRNVVHCALCLTASLVAVGLLYLGLGAEFVAFAQILVYVGAVAILVVFATLLTRGGGTPGTRVATGPASAVLVAGAVLAALARAILRSTALHGPPHATVAPPVTVREIGGRLLNEEVLPLEAVAPLLTAALLGATVIALRSRPGPAPAADDDANPGKPTR